MTHYETLAVEPDAPLPTIRAAYLRLARLTHPDLGGDAAAFRAVSSAWSVLSDARDREEYDRELAGPQDGWGQDVGWGEDVGFDEPVPPPPAAEPTTPSEPPTARPLDPFDSPPVALPSLESELGRLPQPPAPIRRRALRWFGGAAVLALPIGALLHPAVSGVVLLGTLAFAVAVATWLALRGTSVTSRPAARIALGLCLGSVVFAFVLISSVASSVRPDGSGPSAATGVVLTVAWAGAGASYVVVLRRARRCDEWVAVAQPIHDRWEVAESWNALLRARSRSDCTVLERDTQLGGWASIDVWVLRDAWTGEVLAVTHVFAPRAWADVLGGAGVDVVLSWPSGPVRSGAGAP